MGKLVVIDEVSINKYRLGIFTNRQLLWKLELIDSNVLSNFPNLRYLKIETYLSTHSLRGLETCSSSLKYLIIDCVVGNYVNISPIRSLINLERLVIKGINDIRNIVPILECKKLKYLKIFHLKKNKILNVDGIETLENLHYLCINHHNPISWNTITLLPKLVYLDAITDRLEYPVIIPGLKVLKLRANCDEFFYGRIKDMFPLLRVLKLYKLNIPVKSKWFSDLDNLESLHLKNYNSCYGYIRCHYFNKYVSRLKNFSCTNFFIHENFMEHFSDNLRSIYLSRCELCELDLLKCTNLKNIQIKDINSAFEISLDKINPSNNMNILSISGDVNLINHSRIKYFSNLYELKINNYAFTFDPNFLQDFTSLVYLDLSGTRISEIKSLNAPNLKTLIIDYSFIKKIPFENIPKLDYFSCTSCEIDFQDLRKCNELEYFYAPNTVIKNIEYIQIKSLIEINLLGCNLYNFPFDKFPNVRILNLSFNSLSNIDGIEHCTKLQKLCIDNNMIRNFDPICNLNLDMLSYYNNPIENPNPMTARILGMFNNNVEISSVYHNSQNVHNSTIENHVKQSIINLFKDPPAIYDEQSVIDSNLPAETKQAIIEYCNDDYIHSFHNIKYSELFAYVWARIQSSNHSEELLKILSEQINDSHCKCFTGRITRTLSVLSVFYPDINIMISDNDRISSIIIELMKKHHNETLDNKKHIIKQALLDSGYQEHEIIHWVNAIDDYE